MHFRLYSLKAELANGDACASDLLRERSQKKLQGSEGETERARAVWNLRNEGQEGQQCQMLARGEG